MDGRGEEGKERGLIEFCGRRKPESIDYSFEVLPAEKGGIDPQAFSYPKGRTRETNPWLAF